MDKNLNNYLDPNHKLTKAASFTELTSITRKVFLEENCQFNDGGSLVRQYSCEQVFNCESLNSSEKLKFNKSSSFQDVSLTKPQDNLLPSKFEQLSLSNQTLNLTKSGMSFKSILAPPKLVIHQTSNKSETKSDIDYEKQWELDIFKKPSVITRKLKEKCDENQCESNIICTKSDIVSTKTNENKQIIEGAVTLANMKSADKNTDIENKSKNMKKFKFYCFLLFFVSIAVLALCILKPAGVVNYIKTLGYCHSRYNVKYLPLELRKVVHGQSEAINIISEKFLEIDKKNGLIVMSFVGGIGVGKSLVAEIIKKNVQFKNYNVIDYFPPFYKKVQDTYFSLSKCYCNLIRLENLKRYDIKDTAYFINELKSLVKKDSHNYCIILIAIFNPQDVDNLLNRQMNLSESINLINKSFKEYNIQFTTVPFKPLNEEVLLQCINDAADYTNRKLSKKDIMYIKKDLINANSGCKGAYAKVQLIDKVEKEVKMEL